MPKEFLGRGWKFPVTVDKDNQIAASEYEEDIKQAIWIILTTSRGERVMRPDFGCGLHDFVFTYINASTLTLVANSVREALALWEPRIELINIKTSTEELKNGKLLINIEYKVISTNNQYNLVYPFYLNEGE